MRKRPKLGEKGYARIASDAYRTPRWVTEWLLDHVDIRGHRIWEPACGDHDITAVLASRFIGANITTMDIRDIPCTFPGINFCGDDLPGVVAKVGTPEIVITNPPYDVVEEFLRRCLNVTEDRKGIVALLLGHDFDTTEHHQEFTKHPAFYAKLRLPRRIKWVGLPERNEKGKKMGPRQIHAWYIFDWKKEPATRPIAIYP